eukprot:g4551.t1
MDSASATPFTPRNNNFLPLTDSPDTLYGADGLPGDTLHDDLSFVLDEDTSVSGEAAAGSVDGSRLRASDSSALRKRNDALGYMEAIPFTPSAAPPVNFWLDELESATVEMPQEFRVPPAPRYMTAEEKRAARLARNRVSARRSRQRKKETQANLGKEVERLSKEIDMLRRQIVSKQLKMSYDNERIFIGNEVRRWRASSFGRLGISPTTGNVFERWSNEVSGGVRWKSRENVALALRERLKKEILPLHSKFLLWLVSCQGVINKGRNEVKGENATLPKSGVTEEGPRSQDEKIWTLLMERLNVELPQEQKILMKFRDIVSKGVGLDVYKLRVGLSIAEKIRETLSKRMTKTKVLCENIFQVLTNDQILVLLSFIDKYKDEVVAANFLSNIAFDGLEQKHAGDGRVENIITDTNCLAMRKNADDIVFAEFTNLLEFAGSEPSVLQDSQISGKKPQSQLQLQPNQNEYFESNSCNFTSKYYK